VTRYDGLHRFDADQIDRALELDKELDKGVRHLASKISDFYVRRGFLDAEVNAEELGARPTGSTSCSFACASTIR